MHDPSQKDFYVELGRRIMQLRRQRGLSQAEFGMRMKPPVTRACVSSLELGTRRVHAHMLASIRDALQVSADELLPPSLDDGEARPAPSSGRKTLPVELSKNLPPEVASKLLAKIRGEQ